MSETKFTPGPWRIEVPKANRGNWIQGPGGEFVALACRIEAGEEIEDANAHMIASAPDLYAALEEIVTACEADLTSPATELGAVRCEDDEPVAVGPDGDSHLTFGPIRRGRAVLAKARGETP